EDIEGEFVLARIDATEPAARCDCLQHDRRSPAPTRTEPMAADGGRSFEAPAELAFVSGQFEAQLLPLLSDDGLAPGDVGAKAAAVALDDQLAANLGTEPFL